MSSSRSSGATSPGTAAALHVSRSAKDSGDGTTKGDRARAVLIDPYLVEVLREHRAAQAASGLERRVFVSPQGKQLDRHNVRRRGHEPAVKGAGLSPALRLHDLRHTAATLWLSAGESIYFAQQQLGHRDIQTTIDLYGHPDQAAHREAAARAASWWRESGTTKRYHGPVDLSARRQDSAPQAGSA